MNRRDLKTLLALSACVATACLAFWLGMRARWGIGVEPLQTDTILIRDTLVVRQPQARDTAAVRTVYLRARAGWNRTSG